MQWAGSGFMGILSLFKRAPRSAHDAITTIAGDGFPIGEPAPADPIARERLLPFLRSRSALAMQRLIDRIDGTDKARPETLRAVGSDLVLDLLADTLGAPSPVDPQQLRDLGLDPAEAVALATANLRRRSEPSFTTLGPGVFVSAWRDGNDSARLLLPDMIAALPVTGDPVVLAPVRGMLLVTGADDKNGLLTMAAAAAETLSTSSEPLSAQPLRLRDGEWIDFTGDPVELASLHDLMRGQWIRAYAEQKELLDQLHQQQDDDIFVANHAPMRDRRSGRPFCMTFWADGLSSLLPQADVIAFKTAAEVIVVPWDAAMPIVGHRMAHTEHYPVRLRVDSFPTADELDRLHAVATLAKPVKTG
jgi:hypothetical protein